MRFLNFINRVTFLLLFIVIEAFALRYYTKSSVYNQAKAKNVSNFFVGDIYAGISEVRQYLRLRSENNRLTTEVAMLRDSLMRMRNADTLQIKDIALDSMNYSYSQARVINNTISRTRNYITLNKGNFQGIQKDMALISNGAIVGYTVATSAKFAEAISILNTDFRASGKIKGSDYFGPIYWDAHNYDEIVLDDIPKYAPIKIGDTILTTQYSSIFPEGLIIGTVNSFELVNGTNYQARIKIAANLSSLNNVVLIKYEDLEEKKHLEDSVKIENW